MSTLVSLIRRIGYTSASFSSPRSNIFKNAKRLPGVNDMKDPWEVCKSTLKNLKDFHKSRGFPYEADVLIAGGGLVSSAIAYYLSKKTPALKVVVIERDNTYSSASSVVAFGGFRSQFSLEENIELSLSSMSLLRELSREKDLPSHLPRLDLEFNHQPYLILANEKQAEHLEYSYSLQRELGAKVCLLAPAEVKTNFPWLSIKDVELASYAMVNEGWLNPWNLLVTLRSRASFYGTRFVSGEIIGFDLSESHYYFGVEHKVKECLVLCHSDGNIRPITNAYIVIANGSSAPVLASKCGIGNTANDERLSSYLPVAPVRRHMFLTYATSGGSPYDSPIVVDPTGTVFVRCGPSNHYIVCDAMKNTPNNDIPTGFSAFENVRDILYNRVQSFDNLTLKTMYAGSIDYNLFDGNWIIGSHPYLNRVLFACGSSGMGIQHALAVGRAISELIHYRCFKTLDLSRLSFARLDSYMPLSENLIA